MRWIRLNEGMRLYEPQRNIFRGNEEEVMSEEMKKKRKKGT